MVVIIYFYLLKECDLLVVRLLSFNATCYSDRLPITLFLQTWARVFQHAYVFLNHNVLVYIQVDSSKSYGQKVAAKELKVLRRIAST